MGGGRLAGMMTSFVLLLSVVVAATEPTVGDLAYGEHERQKMDLYLVPDATEPTPVLLFIHGGGFVKGSKAQVSPRLIEAMHAAGISVAAINYRFITTDPLPTAMHDAARAVQFLRCHATEYNLDPAHFGASGGSAGAGISLWLAMHDDLADPASDDPVARESTRLSCAAVSAAQVSYDPRFWVKLGLERGLAHSSFALMFGKDVDEQTAQARAEASAPIEFLSADDPPMRLDYGVPNELADDTPLSAVVHHPRQGLALREACEPMGVTCVVYYPGGDRPTESAFAFVVRYLKGE